MTYVDLDEGKKTFKELYSEYYNQIYNYIYRNILNKETAEDITSKTFLNALKNIIEKKPKIKSFHAWIFKIATNEVLLYIKRHKHKDNSADIEDEICKSDISLNQNDKNPIDNYIDFLSLKESLKKLKPKERIIIDLYYFQRKKYSEISEILSIKENTLRPMMSNILKKLKNILNK